MQVKDAAPDLDTYPQSGLVCTQSAAGKHTKKVHAWVQKHTNRRNRQMLAKTRHFLLTYHFNRLHRRNVDVFKAKVS